jgi:hypothetical protein
MHTDLQNVVLQHCTFVLRLEQASINFLQERSVMNFLARLKSNARGYLFTRDHTGKMAFAWLCHGQASSWLNHFKWAMNGVNP